jgi:hypothetical protein
MLEIKHMQDRIRIDNWRESMNLRIRKGPRLETYPFEIPRDWRR